MASATLGSRLWYLQIVRGDEYLRLSEANRTRTVRRSPPRGLILDATGAVLATSRPRILVRLAPDEVKRHPEVFRRLARLLETDPATLKDTYEENYIDPYQPVVVARDVSMEAATRVEERRYSLPGVTIGPEPVRCYEVGEAFGHLLGYMGKCSDRDLKERGRYGYRLGDACGKTGVEGGRYDGDLRGRDGATVYEVDALGRIYGELSSTDPVPGATLRLSIRADLQAVAYRELVPHVRRGRSAAIVAMDPSTGAVLTMVSVPSFDPRMFEGGIPRKRWQALQNDPRRPLINRATASATAPGSVFKVITAIAALEMGKTSRYDGAYCTGVMHLGRWPKRCHRRSGHGHVDFTQALAKSCDIFFYRLGQRLGPENMARYARMMGFGSRTGIDIAAGEVEGIVPDPEWKRKRKLGPWVGGDTVDYAIGQAMLGCTPLQVCNAFCAIANGGKLYRPHVVASVTRYKPDGSTLREDVKPELIRELTFRPGTLPLVRRALEAVVQPGGTGIRASLPGVRVAGKTGTAQRRRRGQMVNDAWFAAYAPADNPRIAVCVYVEEGGHGGEVAAPIARAVMASYLGIRLEASSEPTRTED